MADIREEARAEAEKRVRESPSPDGPEADREYVSGFVNGVHWADARKVKVTEDMVERTARVIYDEASAMQVDAWDTEDPTEREFWLNRARAALSAALGGEQS